MSNNVKQSLDKCIANFERELIFLNHQKTQAQRLDWFLKIVYFRKYRRTINIYDEQIIACEKNLSKFYMIRKITPDRAKPKAPYFEFSQN